MQDSPGQMTTDPSGKVPLIRNPLFPLVAAVWCAALFGLGSLALGSTSLENIVLTLRIDRIVPAAAPPLGFTARLLFALLLAMGGAALGLLVGLSLRRRPAGVAMSEPVAVKEVEAVDEGEDLARLEAARENRPLRRRALTTDLSEGEPGVLKVAELDVLAPLEPKQAYEQASAAPQAEAPAAAEPAERPAPTPMRAPPPVEDLVPPRRFGRPAVAATEPPSDPIAAPAPDSPLEALSVDQLIERLARALAGRSSRSAPVATPAAQTPQRVEPLPTPSAVAEQAAPPASPPPPAPARAEAPSPRLPAPPTTPDRPFDMPASMRAPSVGDVDWFEPSDEDIAREDAALASLLPPRRREPAAPPSVEPAPAPETVQAPPAAAPLAHVPDTAPAPVPAATPSASVPLMPGDVELWNLPEPTEDESEDEARHDPGFSSLLDIQPAARAAAADSAPFVRVETDHADDLAEPVVIFPGHAAGRPVAPARLPGGPGLAQATSPVQTEAALREALAALQKMSGKG